MTARARGGKIARGVVLAPALKIIGRGGAGARLRRSGRGQGVG